MKINLDKYYTPADIAQLCVDKTLSIIQPTSFLEPCAGGGVFLNYLPIGTLAYDIHPEDPRIVLQDFLTLQLPYQQGRCVIGNPPFGCGKSLIDKFLKQSMLLGDYIAFILPISQYQNNYSFYQWKLIESIDLCPRIYSGHKIHCCFNIYQRPTHTLTKPDYTLKMVNIIESRRGNKHTLYLGECDYRVCGFGIIGKKSPHPNTFCSEMCFIINSEWKDRVIDVLDKCQWFEEFPSVTGGRYSVHKWIVYKYIKSQLPDII